MPIEVRLFNFRDPFHLKELNPKLNTQKTLYVQNVNDVTCKCLIPFLIIKITISLIVIGSKNSYFPLIHSPSCFRTACYRTVFYRTVQQTNHIQSCSLNQPITTLVSITIETVYKLLNLCILCQFFNVNFPVVTSLGYFSFLGNCNFYD